MKHFLLVIYLLFHKFCFSQIVIHKDAYDIKKINASILGFARFGNSMGAHLRLSYYPSPRVRFLTNTYHGFGGPAIEVGNVKNIYRPNNKETNYFLQEVEMDYHILDKNKKKKINVVIDWSDNGYVKSHTYAKVDGEARRILAMTLGFSYQHNKEEIYNSREDKGGYYLLNLTTRNNELVSKMVVSDISYYNMLIGLKFKSISANGIKDLDGFIKFNDMHLETYATLILPISQSYLPYVYSSENKVSTPTHYILDSKVVPGFKFGIFHRNSIRHFWCPGFEFGRKVIKSQSLSRGWFFNMSLGMSLNFGKINTITTTK
jgi:hypothetical protein